MRGFLVFALGLFLFGAEPAAAAKANCDDAGPADYAWLDRGIVVHCHTGIQFGESLGDLERQVQTFGDERLGVGFFYRDASQDQRLDIYVYPILQDIGDYAFARNLDPKSHPVLFQEFRGVLGAIMQVKAGAEVRSAEAVKSKSGVNALLAELTIGSAESRVMLTSFNNHYVKVRYSVPARIFSQVFWDDAVENLLQRVAAAAGR